MNATSRLLPKYAASRALLIGINAYRACGPLGYARQDAEAVGATLQARCGFPPDAITLLVDEQATGNAIRAAFLRFASSSEVDENDRLLVFFAGHGYTRSTARGEVGFLVPVDGDPNDLSTLLRWDDLTRNAELIPAKHILFVMDACYGGLAITRALPAGSSRFLRDMLTRTSRQVLTAGKADEVVADSGGPRPGHSVFTGHFLDALEGAAATADGILSANAVIAYVYDRVAKDPYSRQTPHYGYLDGDGDLILVGSDRLNAEPQPVDEDIVIQSSPTLDLDSGAADVRGASRLKKLLSDPAQRIELHDHVSRAVRKTLALTAHGRFSADIAVSKEAVQERIAAYENAAQDLVVPAILLARWGDAQQSDLLQNSLARVADPIEPLGGFTVWLVLRWFPVEYLMYAAGVAALSIGNYVALAKIFAAPVPNPHQSQTASTAILVVPEQMAGAHDAFKQLPDYERRYTPRSDYLHKQLQPTIEDLLFLGKSYEHSFDRFEMLYALCHADHRQTQARDLWAPPGRFGWKGRRGIGNGPCQAFIDEAIAQGDRWPALQAGLFGGSIARFKEVAIGYRDNVVNRLPWF